MNLTTRDKENLSDDLRQAQDCLRQAIDLIDNYVRQTGDLAAEAYLVDPLKIMAGRDHGFLAGDLHLDDLIEQLQESEPEDDEGEGAAEEDLPEVKVVGPHTLYLLRNALGPVRNDFGEPIYVTIPVD